MLQRNVLLKYALKHINNNICFRSDLITAVLVNKNILNRPIRKNNNNFSKVLFPLSTQKTTVHTDGQLIIVLFVTAVVL